MQCGSPLAPLPCWAYPSPRLVLAALALAHLLDVLYPFHRGLLLKLHPVHTAYIMARRLVPPGSTRLRGLAGWAATMTVHLAAYTLLLAAAWRLGTLAWLLAAAWTLKVSFSLRLLLETVWRAAELMERGDWRGARRLVQGLVRRNVYALGRGHVVSAAVESLAESLVDGYTSPLLYAVLLGPLGALAQRIANTLDSALGYKTPEYLHAGWVSAKADTLLNYIPARLTGLMILLAAPLNRVKLREALRCWLEYRGKTESVNAGNPMAAMACTLGVKLEKPGHYSLGRGSLPTPAQARKSVKIAATIAALHTLIIAAFLYAAA